MSRLCRLKTKSHGDDGLWAYNEIVKLRKQRDELLAAAKLVLGNASLDEGFTALTEAVRKCEGEAK